jgi:hypothetical protein
MDRFEILTYHHLGINKYKQLGLKNSIISVEEPSELDVVKAKQLILGK